MQCSLSCPSWNIAVFQTLCSWQVPCAVATVYWQKTTILMLHTMRWCMPDTLHLSTAKFCLLGMVAAICINNHVTTYISNASVNSMIFHQNMKCLQALDRSAFFLQILSNEDWSFVSTLHQVETSTHPKLLRGLTSHKHSGPKVKTLP